MKHRFIYLLSLSLVLLLFIPTSSLAKEDDHLIIDGQDLLTQTVHSLEAKDTAKAKQSFNQFKYWWEKNKQALKTSFPDHFIEMERQVGLISVAFLNDDVSGADEQIEELKAMLSDTDKNQSPQVTLPSYIQKLKETKALVKDQNWEKAEENIKTLQTDWLSVEGSVVSQSKSAYTESEKNLVLLGAYVNSPNDRAKLIPMIDETVKNLEPLVSSTYGLWDAALIPIREGLEALLVVGALLSFSKKAQSNKAKHWVWGGAISGMGLCLIVGIIVSFLISTAAFGKENALINGLSGVIASVLLLYVSYWLHRHSDIQRWNRFIKSKSEKAITNGRMLSFAFIAFLAIVREGFETVIFLIGMVGRMSVAELLTGIATGFLILIILGVLILKMGVKLPLKPFFLISSFIVFYLCLKFMGSGMHSLQIAGILPSRSSDYLPSISWISIYPSWISFLPQLVFIVIAILVIAMKRINKKGDQIHA
ncbi:MAG: FTR1 family iron permease [Tuberibacillus sp.]